MASLFQYQRLKPELALDVIEGDDRDHHPKIWSRARPILQRSSSRVWRVPVGRRLRLGVTGLLIRRLLRRKARLVAAAVRKVVRRLKEGRGHFGDLLAGNYLFHQVNPSTPAMEKRSVDGSNNSYRRSLQLTNVY